MKYDVVQLPNLNTVGDVDADNEFAAFSLAGEEGIIPRGRESQYVVVLQTAPPAAEGTTEEPWTPDTAAIRRSYASDPESEYRDPIGHAAYTKQLERLFDRWLAKHDVEIAEQAWDDGFHGIPFRVPGQKEQL